MYFLLFFCSDDFFYGEKKYGWFFPNKKKDSESSTERNGLNGLDGHLYPQQSNLYSGTQNRMKKNNKQ